MAEKEAALPEGERIDFVSIVTPNNTHFEIAKTFLEAGFNVVCDKPMTKTLDEAKMLRDIVAKSGKLFVLTHNYTGYPMVKEARKIVREGKLGRINRIVVEYSQGWLSGLLRGEETSINIWRMNPEKAGVSCSMGDIGTHAENLSRYITGLPVKELCADLTAFIEQNPLDDDGNVLLHFEGGAKGILTASQIATGDENGLRIRIYGNELGLEWSQEDPNYLIMKDPHGIRNRYSKGNDNLSETARDAGRLPPGHPDGFIEAFANVYREAFRGMRAVLEGRPIPELDCPNIEDGVIGLSFIETVVESSRSGGRWLEMKR